MDDNLKLFHLRQRRQLQNSVAWCYAHADPSPYNSLSRPLGHLADEKCSAPIHLVPTQTPLSVSSIPPVLGCAQPSAFLLPHWCSQPTASHDWRAALPALSRVALQALFTPLKVAAVTSESQLRRMLPDFRAVRPPPSILRAIPHLSQFLQCVPLRDGLFRH